MDYATPDVKVPLRERINFRLFAFLAIAIALVGMPIYWYLDTAISGGIKDRGDYVEVDLKSMSTFAFDQTNGKLEDVPGKWRALNGKKIQVVGEMWLGNSAGDQVQQFDLVYSIAKCCFSGPPQIQHFVQARGRNGKAMPYMPGLVRVTGTLHVNVKRGAQGVESVYQLTVDSIEPA
jgi:hypothetical protein